MSDRCKHELLPGQCGDCAPRARRGGHAPGGVAAGYYGQCSDGCGRRVEPGDLIVPDPAGDGWMHQDCW